jgi:hypothetical protein
VGQEQLLLLLLGPAVVVVPNEVATAAAEADVVAGAEVAAVAALLGQLALVSASPSGLALALIALPAQFCIASPAKLYERE